MTISPENKTNSVKNATISYDCNTQKRHAHRPFIISVTSGKGGVGKTITTVNLAFAARRMGKSVLVLDGDLGLANVDVVLGRQARYNIRDVLEGKAEMNDIVIDGPMGIRLIPSGSGVSNLAQLSNVQRIQILAEIGRLNETADVLLIDTGAGIAGNVLHFNHAADKVVVVTTPEPHAMTDAYALIKVLTEERGCREFGLLVNFTRTPAEGEKIAERITDVATNFLKVDVEYLGSVPMDPQVQKFVMQRRAACEQSTHTIAGQAWNEIARKMLTVEAIERCQTCIPNFWKNLFIVGQKNQEMAGATI